ncbi:MAG TPA: hypothetical protein VJN88_09265 [Ktedonobacterales bacterium]|nr:hypothetical protein [Ktedonobacterales bacterium]
MDAQALALQSWQHVTLGLALELAIGSAYLLFIALTGRRWRRDIALALPPLAAFVWMVRVAGSMRAQTIYWSSYARFVDAHYPPGRYPLLAAQTKDDYTRAVTAATHIGWTAVVVTECVIVLTIILVRQWTLPRWKAAPVVAPAQLPDDTGNELEIVIEPLGVEGGDTFSI